MPLKLIPPGGRKGNAVYYVRGRVGGAEHEASTGTADPALAERFRRAYARRLADRRLPRPGEDLSFAAAARLYAAWRRPGRADDKRLARLCAMLGGRSVAGLGHADLVAAAHALHPGCAPATKNRDVLRPAAAVLHYAAAAGYCPYLRLPLLKEPRPRTRALGQEAARALIAAAAAERPALTLLLLWLFRQGDRIADALALAWDDIDLATRTVRRRIGKSDEWRLSPLHAEVFAALANQAHKRGRLFPWHSKSGVYKPLRRAAARAGIAFTPHMARHSMATWLVEGGADLRTVMDAGGWRDLKSVARYASPGIEHVRAAGDRLPPLLAPALPAPPARAKSA